MGCTSSNPEPPDTDGGGGSGKFVVPINKPAIPANPDRDRNGSVPVRAVPPKNDVAKSPEPEPLIIPSISAPNAAIRSLDIDGIPFMDDDVLDDVDGARMKKGVTAEKPHVTSASLHAVSVAVEESLDKNMNVLSADLDSPQVMVQHPVQVEHVDAEHKAAAKIQAHFKGYKVRKDKCPIKVVITPADDTNDDGIDVSDDVTTTSDMSAATHPHHQDSTESHRTPNDGATHGRHVNNDTVPSTTEEDEKLAAAATRIQATYKGFVVRRESRKNKEEEKSKRKSFEGYVKENKAATQIQSHFKGYKVRKDTRDSKQAHEKHAPATQPATSDVTSSSGDHSTVVTSPSEDKAAATIQAHYRGFKTRRSLKENK